MISLECIQRNNGSSSEFEVDILVMAIGRESCLDFIGKVLKNKMEILKKANRLHLIGDVKNDRFRQTAICVGDGIKSAMKIYQTMKSIT